MAIMRLNFHDNPIYKKKREVEDIQSTWKRSLLFNLKMGCFKKGQRQKSTDLWQKAGGRDLIIRSFIFHGFGEVIVSPEQSSLVTLAVFKSNNKDYQKWLKVIWKEDRRGVRTEVLHAGKL